MTDAIKAELGDRIYAIEALRIFTATTRGMCIRERKRIAAFVCDILENSKFSHSEIETWAMKLGYVNYSEYRNGNTDPYEALLNRIPKNLMKRTSDYATLIARGSGRKPIPALWQVRIEMEFSLPPRVPVPVFPDDDEEYTGPTMHIEITLKPNEGNN